MFWLRTFSNWTRKTVKTNWGNNGQHSCSPSVWQQFGPVGKKQVVEQHGSFNINHTLNYLKWWVVKNSGLLHSWGLQGNTLTRYLILDTYRWVRTPAVLTCSLSASCWCVATATSSFPSSPRTSWRLTSRATASARSACWSATSWNSPCLRITSTATSCESSRRAFPSLFTTSEFLARCSCSSVTRL